MRSREATRRRQEKLDVPMPAELREAVRRRAASLDLRDAQYVRHVVRRDIEAATNENASAPLETAGGMTHTPLEGADEHER